MRGRRGEGMAGGDGIGQAELGRVRTVSKTETSEPSYPGSIPCSRRGKRTRRSSLSASIYTGGTGMMAASSAIAAETEELGRERESQAREQASGETGEEQVGGSSCPCPPGGTPTREWGVGMGAEEVAAWRQWPWLPLCGKRNFSQNPLTLFSVNTKESTSSLVDFI